MRRAEATAIYLKETAQRPITLWSFIKYVARKTNPNTARRFHRTLREELNRMHKAGLVVRCKSVRGKTAYRRRSDYPSECPF